MESQVLLRMKMQEAAHFDANTVSPSLFQSLGYRQRLAQEVLLTTDDHYREVLMTLFEDSTLRIKLILGL